MAAGMATFPSVRHTARPSDAPSANGDGGGSAKATGQFTLARSPDSRVRVSCAAATLTAASQPRHGAIRII